MGESGAYPTSTSTIGRWFPESETGRSMSALFIGQNAGAAIAPLMIVPIAIHFGWRAPFYVNGAIGLIWVIICWRWFRNEPREKKNISKEEIALIEDKRRFLRHDDPFPWKTVLGYWRTWAILLGFFCSQWGLYFFVAWMPIYLQQGRHLSENHMKLTTSFLFILGVGSAFFSGFLNDWLVRKKGLVFGRRLVGSLGLGLAGILLIVTASASDNHIAVLSLLACGFCYHFFAITAFSTCVDIGGAKSGTMTGIMNFFGQTGAFLLSISFGKIADVMHNYNTPVFLIAGILMLGAVSWLAIDPSRKIEGLGNKPVTKTLAL